jgi:Fe-S-cluster containining protein
MKIEGKNEMEHESLCAKCARVAQTCCQNHDIYITLGDLDRIGAFIGRKNFFEFRPCLDESYMNQEDDPLWDRYVLMTDGKRRVLKTKGQGDCTFLEASGCVLPLGIRPLICRLHPFAYTAKGICGIAVEGCPTHLLDADKSVIEAIGMDMNSALLWHKMLYTEITEGDKTHENRLNL